MWFTRQPRPAPPPPCPSLYDPKVLFPANLPAVLAKSPCPAQPSVGSSGQTRLWLRRSHWTSSVVGILSRIYLRRLNRTRVFHRERLLKVLQDRAPQVPLITVANHHSTVDEPLLWGILNFGHLVDYSTTRWALGAHDICFTNKLHSTFFSLGKTIPIIRGSGLYQPGMDFSLSLLKHGLWVHIYPEGRVNMSPETGRDLRLKWGVGRLIADADQLPVVLPIYLVGMDSVLPPVRPYIPRVGRQVTVCVGEPVSGLADTLADARRRQQDDVTTRKRLTDLVQESLANLGQEARTWHAKHRDGTLT